MARRLLSSFKKLGCPSQKLDKGIDAFLACFNREGRFSLEMGYWMPKTRWDSMFKEYVTENQDEYINLVIHNGDILDKERKRNLIDLAQTVGQPLPEFDGEELQNYALIDGEWIDPKDTDEKGFFYVSFYSLE